MRHQNNSYTSVITPILKALHTYPGTSFTEEELCQQIDCTPLQARLALDVLVRARLVRKEPSDSEDSRYTWGSS